ncbi:MAG: hypothetical protein RQ758_01915 [Methanomicrobiaceae archaeon]|nr:hypothetical protein [Methanomicrobiaceae archaeon]
MNGAEVIHLLTGMGVVVGTHPIPQNYDATHANPGTRDAVSWKELLAPTLTNEKTRVSYDS